MPKGKPDVYPPPKRPARDFEDRAPIPTMVAGLLWLGSLLALSAASAVAKLGIGLPLIYFGFSILIVGVVQPPYLWHALRQRRPFDWFPNEDAARWAMGLLGLATVALGIWMWRVGAG